MASFASAMGKPPASQEHKKALDPTFYSSCSDLSASLPRNTAIQTVAAYMASKPSLHLGGDLLQHPIAVVGMGAVHDDVAAFLVPFLNAFFDVTAFQAAPPIPAFAASRLRLLRLPQSAALLDQAVLEVASRHCSGGTLFVLTSERLSGAGGSVAKHELLTPDGKSISVVAFASNASVEARSQLTVRAVLRVLGVEPCVFFECVMNALTESLILCPLCLRKVSLVQPQLNIVRRYTRILEATKTQESSFWSTYRLWCKDHLAWLTNGQVITPAVDSSKLRLLKKRLATRRRSRR
ncbi:hypothetical protein AeRB84_014328 [Aphanomyces euteiches]|nr:hypothetical protein AeRB84_014328 [Aphanomyces euteiches]